MTIGTYRESTPVRIIRTRLALLPDALRAPFVAAKPGATMLPLRSAVAPGLFLLGGLFLFGVAYIASQVANFNADNANLALGAGTIGLALFTYGLLNAIRTMTVSLRFRAVLLSPTWLACTPGAGSRVDLIPLVMIERVVPSEKWLEVILREGRATLRYPYRFEVAHTAFFDVVRGAIPAAALPTALPPALDRDVNPFTRIPALVIALGCALCVGIPGMLLAVHHRTAHEYEIYTHIADDGLREAESEPEPQRSQHRVRSLEFFEEHVRGLESQGGVPWWMLEKWTDLPERRGRYTRVLNEARAANTNAATDEDTRRVASAHTYQELRQIAARHPNTPIAEHAIARVAELLDRARASAASNGATPEQLAQCDAVRAMATRTPRPSLVIALFLPDATSDERAFATTETTGFGRGYGHGLLEVAHDAFRHGLEIALDEVLVAAFEMHASIGAESEAAITVHTTFAPIGPAFTYTRTRVRNRETVDAYSFPNILVTVSALTHPDRNLAPLTDEFTYRGAVGNASPESLAQTYSTGEALYRSISDSMGSQLGWDLARRLCLLPARPQR